ncbi:hypothetical protein [Halodesulfovibrio sp.]|uniref:hypothetical protein n=1 Tax=Halodesulfovibrio sp. TaxID=1912772 RepID=UPI0025D6B1F8|nr:hypothetical protein [Halodesulfovibrio sp.]MCT4535859.1 hypothetical protein [Halodesulfovibrio sp.]
MNKILLATGTIFAAAFMLCISWAQPAFSTPLELDPKATVARYDRPYHGGAYVRTNRGGVYVRPRRYYGGVYVRPYGRAYVPPPAVVVPPPVVVRPAPRVIIRPYGGVYVGPRVRPYPHRRYYRRPRVYRRY